MWRKLLLTLLSAWQIPTSLQQQVTDMSSRNKQTNKASAIGRPTSFTQSDRAKWYFWRLHNTFSSWLRSEQEVASNKAWEAKGAGSPKISKAMPMTPSVIKTSLPLWAHTSHHQQRTVSYGSRLIVRAKVVDKGQQEDRRLAKAGKKKKKKAVPSKGSWLPKSKSIT